MFLICFITGLASHITHHPKSYLEWPSTPRHMYRVISATHLITAMMSIPLLVAKVWVSYPMLWQRPVFRGAAHAVERISLLFLVGGSLFLYVRGLAHALSMFSNAFEVRPTHYWAAWITMGALVVHVVVKFSIIRKELLGGRRTVGAPPRAVTDGSAPARIPAQSSEQAPVQSPEQVTGGATPKPVVASKVVTPDQDPETVTIDDPAAADRRRFLMAVGAASGILGVNYLSIHVSSMHKLALLTSRRADVGIQGLPVQTTVAIAGVGERAFSPDYRLRVVGRVGKPLEFTVADLHEMATHEAFLPITCVQGWSVGATWRGVRIIDLLHMAGAVDFNAVISKSIQADTKPKRLFGYARLNRSHALHPDTMLATHLNGELLHPNHGYPVRLIAPNQPGVKQTKWVEELRVR